MAMKTQRFARLRSRKFFRNLGFSNPNIWFCLLAYSTAFSLQAADTNPPVVVSAGCFDGQTIGVCFSEALDPVSATNLANYHIFDTGTWFRLASTNFPIVEASLRPDQRSVVLKLLEAFPGTVFSVSVTNVRDLEGNWTRTGSFTPAYNLSAADIGNPGVDPKEPGSLFFSGSAVLANPAQGLEVVAGGSGLDGTNDSFYFIYEPWRSSGLSVETQVASLDAANRFSSAGLMVREDLSPGSRFFSVTLTPPDVPARDGSGRGANIIQVRFRDAPASPSVNISNSIVDVPYSNLWFSISRLEQKFFAQFTTNRSDWYTLSEVTFSSPFPDRLFVGTATFSHNNNPGFTTTAHYAEYYLVRSDVFTGPRLVTQHSPPNLVLSWTEPHDWSFYLVSTPKLDSREYGVVITNP